MDTISNLENLVSDFKNKNQRFLKEIPSLTEKIRTVCSVIERSWSGSFSGYHGSLYYGDFEPPPLDRRFSVEWGTIHGLPEGWRQRQPEEVMKEIEGRIGGDFSTKRLEKDSTSFLEFAKEFRENILDIIGLPGFPRLTERMLATIQEIQNTNFGKPRKIFGEYIKNRLPKTRVSRDLEALAEGVYIPTPLYCEAVAHEAKKNWELANDFMKLVQRLNRQLYDVNDLTKEKQNNMDIKFENLHKEILKKCGKLYNDGSYAEAVEKSFKVVRDRLRDLTGYEKGSEAFGKGKLHIKGVAASNVDFDFNEAVKFLTMAIDFFRNEKSHTSDANIDDPVRAYEYLRLSSLAMHLLENAEIKIE
jgi:uncharacterized protein (TIGR02391 family)